MQLATSEVELVHARASLGVHEGFMFAFVAATLVWNAADIEWVG